MNMALRIIRLILPYPAQQHFHWNATGTGNNIALTSYPHIRIFTDHVIPAQEDIAYRNCIYHRGGSRKVTYQLLSGNLPAGISLSIQGDLSGILWKTALSP